MDHKSGDGAARRAGAWLSTPVASAVLGGMSLATLVTVAFVAVLAGIFASTELIFVADGVGNDGYLYSDWIRRATLDVRDLGLGSYTAQRLFGVLLARLVLDAAHAPPTPANIVRTFQVLDVAFLSGALACFRVSARHLRLTRAGYLVGVGLWVLTFGVLRWIPFDPVLTDAQAVFLGAAALALYLARRPFSLALLTFFGAFMWPSFGACGVVLLFFPRSPPAPEPRPAVVESPRHVALLAGALVAVILAGALFLPSPYPGEHPFPGFPGTPRLFALSCALLALVSFFALRPLMLPVAVVGDLKRRDALARTSRMLALGTGLAVYLGIRWVTSRSVVTPVEQENVAASLFLKLTMFLAVRRPLGFLVGHASFFGMGAIVLILRWRHACRIAGELGLGLVAIMGMALLLGLNSESRRLFALSSVALPLGALSLGRRLRPRTLIELAVMALVASQAWFRIVQKPAVDFASFYFHGGPWMSNAAYVGQGAVALAFAVRLHFALRADSAAPEHDTIALIEP